jgi:hypothetical protein
MRCMRRLDALARRSLARPHLAIVALPVRAVSVNQQGQVVSLQWPGHGQLGSDSHGA